MHIQVNVIEPTDPGRLAQRTNNLTFVFATSPSVRRPILPTTYSEVLMHVAAHRRHATEGLAGAAGGRGAGARLHRDGGCMRLRWAESIELKTPRALDLALVACV